MAIWSLENFILQTEFSPEIWGEQVTSVSEAARTSGHRSELLERKLNSANSRAEHGGCEKRVEAAYPKSNGPRARPAGFPLPVIFLVSCLK